MPLFSIIHHILGKNKSGKKDFVPLRQKNSAAWEQNAPLPRGPDQDRRWEIRGDYCNVVGLPVAPLFRLLRELGVPLKEGGRA